MRRRAFARSVVVTFSIAELACAAAPEDAQTSAPLPGNPPRPVGDGGRVAPPDPAPNDTSHDAPDPEPEPEPDPETAPDPGPPKVTIHQRPDGTCWETTSVECPPMVMCNPPPPRQVDCPAPRPK
jgi:hypothetical protein